MTGPSEHITAPLTVRESQQIYELTSSIKTRVTLYLSKTHSNRRTYDASRLLMHLPTTTIARIHASLDAPYGKHLCRLLAGTNTYVEPEFIAAYLDLLPQLTEEQQLSASDYFIHLARWVTGLSLPLDLMVRFATQYLEATGSDKLPYTSEADQQLFARLSKEPHLMDPILARVEHTSEITPELVDELAKVHNALIDGAL